MKRYHLILLVCLALIVGCATSPTGRRQLMLVSEDSAISASKQAYVEMLKPYEQKGKIDNDPALKDRVYRITEQNGQRLGHGGRQDGRLQRTCDPTQNY
jgi:outer membrane biogenesis lipoprotein LolB